MPLGKKACYCPCWMCFDVFLVEFLWCWNWMTWLGTNNIYLFFVVFWFLPQEPGLCTNDYPFQRMRFPFSRYRCLSNKHWKDSNLPCYCSILYICSLARRKTTVDWWNARAWTPVTNALIRLSFWLVVGFALQMPFYLLRQPRKYQKSSAHLSVIEAFMDFKAFVNKKRAWIKGLLSRGLEGAYDAASGLDSVHVHTRLN